MTAKNHNVLIILPIGYLHRTELFLDLNWSQVHLCQSTICTCITDTDHAHTQSKHPLLRLSRRQCTTPGCALPAHKPQSWGHTLPLNALLSFGGKPKHRGKRVALIYAMTHGPSYSRQLLTDDHCKKLFARFSKYLDVSMVYINKNIQYWPHWDGFILQRCRKRK